MSRPAVRSRAALGASDVIERSSRENRSERRWRVLLVMLFAAYLVLLVWLVVWKLHVPFIGDDTVRAIKLVPFVRDGGAGSSAPREVLGNFVLFIPFGLYLGLLAPSCPWWKAGAIVAATSLALEVSQYVLAVGKSDVTDVLVNTAGGLTGLAMLALTRRVLHSHTGRVITWMLSIGTVLVLLACANLFAAPPPHLQPQPVDGPLSRSVGATDLPAAERAVV
ncbi:MAG: VanZ family protein [Microbacterium sp.]